MPSQFFGLNIGASALSSFQTSVNTTANNIANVQTTGYTRQTANLASTAAIRVTARYGSMGTGVEVTSITQERNLYYDTKYWQNNSSKGFFEQKLYFLDQIQTILQDDEDSQKGFSTIFSTMFDSGLDTLKTKSEDLEVRNQFINQAQSLCTYFNQLSESLTEMQESCNEEIKTTVDQINATSQKIAILNKQINAIEVRGGYANELRDQRANLIDELSEMVNVETKEYDVHNSYGQDLGGTNYSVYINGQLLVDGSDYRTLDCISNEYLNNQSDAEGLYSIVWSDTGMDFPATGGIAGGSLKALFAVRDGNNKENMKGVVSDATENTITIKNPSVTNVNYLTLPEKGRITINNTHYYYDGWEATLNDEGEIENVTFNLSPEKNTLTDAQAASLKNNAYTVTCGESVDSMGVPYYQAQINEFLRNFTEAFNDIEEKGVDLNGDSMGAFFVGTSVLGDEYDMSDWEALQATMAKDKKDGTTQTYQLSSNSDSYYKITASTICVNAQSLKDPNYFSTASEITNGEAKYDIVEELLTLQNKANMFRGNDAESFLETLLSDITVDVNKNEISSNNYTNLATVISTQRTSVSGVDEDEEALNLIKFQNAYNLASKVISVMAELYDKLINETGVT
jgi:flagellar hook-associated protein 1 FlgK